MSENVKNYSALCSKIGVGMLLFYSFFTLGSVGVEVFSELSKRLMDKLNSEIIYEILSAVIYFFSFSCAAFILRKMTKDLPCSRPIYTSFKLDKWFLCSMIAIIAVNFTLSYVNAVMVSSLSPSFASEIASSSIDIGERPLSEVVIFFVLAIFSTAVVPAICEEYLFRGAILTNLLPYGKTTAILASALLFGLMHQNPLQILYTTLMGVVIGYVYIKTKSIWACMILHFINNFITVLEEYLPVLTKIDWIGELLDFIIMISGAIALLIIVLRKNTEPSIEENGSFGKFYERGMDVEEYALNIPTGQKIKYFFRPTVIIYTVICLLSIVSVLFIFMGG